MLAKYSIVFSRIILIPFVVFGISMHVAFADEKDDLASLVKGNSQFALKLYSQLT